MSSNSNNTVWLTAQSLATMGLGLVSTVLAARLYGPDTMGFITYAIAYTSLFMPLVRLGFDSILIHEILSAPQLASRILWTAITLRAAAAMVVTLIIYLSVRLIEGPATNQLWVSIISLSVFGMIAESFLGALQAQKLIKYGAIARVVVSVLTTSVRIIVLIADLPVTAFVFTYALDAALMILALGITYVVKSPFAAPHRFSASLARRLLRRSWPLIASGMAVAIYGRVDQVMIGAITGESSDAALYAASATLAEVWYFLPVALITVMQVQILSRKDDWEALKADSQRLYDLVALVCLSICVALSLASWIIMRVLYGAEYTTKASVTALIVLTWAGMFAMLGSARSPWLIAHNLQKYSLIYLAAGCVANVLMNLWLIPILGILGAALATLVSQILTSLVLPTFFTRTRQSSYQIVSSFRPSALWRTSKSSVLLIKNWKLK